MGINNLNLDMYRARMERSDAAMHTHGTTRSGSAPASTANGGDRVTVSRDAVLRTETFSAAMVAADIRQEKVDSIREKVASGRYVIDNRRIAAKLVETELALMRRG